MITFSQLGRHGELGNQLFQIAATIGHALENDQHYGFPAWICTRSFNDYSKFFKTPLPLLGDVDLRAFSTYQEESLAYKKIQFIQNKNVDLFGYFQSENYFLPYKENIIEQFKPSAIIHNKIKNIDYTNTVCLQLRFYDRNVYDPSNVFVDVTNNTDFLKAAINYFGKNKNYLVITNNYNKAEAMFGAYKNFHMLKEYNNIEQFFIQTLCEHNIITNSSFGWWGAYLNSSADKVVWAPAKWFCNEDTSWFCSKDIRPVNWRVI